jgi:hypothetical protein
MSRRRWLADATFWASAFAIAMGVQSLTRLLLWLLHAPGPEQGGAWADSGPAFLRGLRFDAAGQAYPFVLLLLLATGWTAWRRGRAARTGNTVGSRRHDAVAATCLLASVVWLGVVELHFFREFRSRLNFIAIEYLGEGETTVRMAAEAVGGWAFAGSLAAFAVLAAASAWAVSRLHRWC